MTDCSGNTTTNSCGVTTPLGVAQPVWLRSSSSQKADYDSSYSGGFFTIHAPLANDIKLISVVAAGLAVTSFAGWVNAPTCAPSAATARAEIRTRVSVLRKGVTPEVDGTELPFIWPGCELGPL